MVNVFRAIICMKTADVEWKYFQHFRQNRDQKLALLKFKWVGN
jgi:hypothetical protein